MQAVTHIAASGFTSFIPLAGRGCRGRAILHALGCLCLLGGIARMGCADDEAENGGVGPAAEKTAKTGPLPLDLAKFCNATTNILHNENGKVYGRCVFDGVPFQVSGTVRLYGQTQAERGDKRPVSAKGLRIGRTFDDLYVIHYAMWPDADGQTIGYLCLNYDDGTESILPIRYGVHLRDWYNLPSYEKEAVKDPHTTVCWRRPPAEYKAPIRLFKSRLANPSPQKVVKTMDIVSARSLAGYNVIAATVADRDAVRGEKLVGDRNFDGKLLIRVVDDSTGQPIEGGAGLSGHERAGRRGRRLAFLHLFCRGGDHSFPDQGHKIRASLGDERGLSARRACLAASRVRHVHLPARACRRCHDEQSSARPCLAVRRYDLRSRHDLR